MKKPLRQSLQQHLNNKSLTHNQLSQLNALQDQAKTAKTLTQMTWLKPVAFVTVLIISLLSLHFANISTLSVEQRIADEVSGNHLKLKPLEINTNTIIDIKKYFKQLEFLPIQPAFLHAKQDTLIGGRYCSILGQTAAQLRIKDNKTGQIESLYEARFDNKLFKNMPILEKNQKPITLYSKGIKVKIWVEKGILFALTDTLATP